MKLQLNGAPLNSDAATLQDLLEQQDLANAKVATAVNGTFVPAGLRKSHVLNDGDSVEILAPMQGG